MKRLVALLLTLVLSFCLFTACAQNATETPAPTPEASTTSSEATPEAASTDKQTTETASGAPDFTGTTVNALIFKSIDTDYIIETLAPRLKAETGIELVVNQVSHTKRSAQRSWPTPTAHSSTTSSTPARSGPMNTVSSPRPLTSTSARKAIRISNATI